MLNRGGHDKILNVLSINTQRHEERALQDAMTASAASRDLVSALDLADRLTVFFPPSSHSLCSMATCR